MRNRSADSDICGHHEINVRTGLGTASGFDLQKNFLFCVSIATEPRSTSQVQLIEQLEYHLQMRVSRSFTTNPYTNIMKPILTSFVFTSSIFFATLFSPQEDQQQSELRPPAKNNRLTSQDTQRDNTVPFMRAKLTGSKKVLEGIVSENFALIEQGAGQMKLISETVRWPKAKDPVYQHHGQEFRDQCDRLSELARAKDLQGAHYAYLHLTTNCFNCHNHVRENFRVEPSPDSKGPVILIPGTWEGEKFHPDRNATLRR